MIGLALVASLAWGSGQVVVVEGELHPGRIGTLQIARSPIQATTSQPGAGPAPADLSDLRLSGASVLRTRTVRTGVTDLEIVPDLEATEVEVRLGTERYRLAVTGLPQTPLALPARVMGTWQDEAIPVTVVSTTTPTLAVADLTAFASEGEVELSDSEDPAAVTVTFAPDPSSGPRVVPVVLVDHRAPRRPALVPVVLRAKPRLTVEASPGSEVSLGIGRRTYGPVTVPDDGVVSLRVDQFPGESVATVRATDDLGNVSTSELPLATTQQPALVVVPSSHWLPGDPPPPLHVVAMLPNGAPWPGTPQCETPRVEVEVRPVGPGWWSLDMPNGGDLWRTAQRDLRVVCTVGDVTRSARVELVRGVPDRLSLDVGPEDLRSDFPVAELRASVEDARGDRIDVRGLTVTAEHGDLVLREQDRTLRGEYLGETAISYGTDTVVARYQRPPGPGPVVALQIGFGDVPGPGGGPFTVHARALNAQREPVAYVPLRLTADGLTRSVMTQADGWASTRFDVPEGRRPRVVSAQTAVVERNVLALPGEVGFGGPEAPDLVARRTVRLSAGRIDRIEVSVEPRILRAAPGNVARIVVRVEDRSGRPVIDEPVGIEASEGRVLDAYPRPDGTWVAQYVPVPGGEPREVQITAEAEGRRYTTPLEVVPRQVRASVGPFVGVQTNFGSLNSMLVGLDLDLRTRSRVLSDALTLRIGMHGTSVSTQVTEPVFAPARIRSTITSLDLGLAARDDRGPVSLWLGLGGTAAVQWTGVRFGGQQGPSGTDVVGGLLVFAGLSRRAPLGEWLLEARGYVVPATEDADIGYTGNLGGVSVGFGYRLVY